MSVLRVCRWLLMVYLVSKVSNDINMIGWSVDFNGVVVIFLYCIYNYFLVVLPAIVNMTSEMSFTTEGTCTRVGVLMIPNGISVSLAIV